MTTAPLLPIANGRLSVYPLCLGANVFGRSADRDATFAVLDAYVAAGGNLIDTANTYADGESERLIGEWLKERGGAPGVFIATKVGMQSTGGLSAASIRENCDRSRERLGRQTIDIYYAHRDDEATPLEETLGAFSQLVSDGSVTVLGASNYSADRLHQAAELSETHSFAPFEVLQPHYNLVERDYEKELCLAAVEHDLAVFPYFALAQGFLTGKYRKGGAPVESIRSSRATAYLDARGERVLDALDVVAARHQVSQAAVSLAWLKGRIGVTAPIASARTVEQLNDLLTMATLDLTTQDVEQLDEASSSAGVGAR